MPRHASSRSRAKPGGSIVRSMRERRRSRTTLPPEANPSETATPPPIPAPDVKQTDVMEALRLRRQASVNRLSELARAAEAENLDLAAIDAVIRLYDPGHVGDVGDWWKLKAAVRTERAGQPGRPDDPVAAKKEVEAFFGEDDRTAAVKKLVGEAGTPLSSGEIAKLYAAAKGVTLSEPSTQLLVSRLSAILARLRNQGRVRNLDTPGHRKLWEIV